MSVPDGFLWVRRLTDIEASMAYMHATLGGNTQVTTLLTLEGGVSYANARVAFNELFSAHAVLRMAIRERDNELWFVNQDDFSRIKIVDETLDAGMSVIALLERELMVPLHPEEALWRVSVCTDASCETTRILFTRHHAISDGYTTTHLIKQFLDVAPGKLERTAKLHTESPAALPLPRSVSQIVCPPRITRPGRGPLAFFEHAKLVDRGTGVCIEYASIDSLSKIEQVRKKSGHTLNTIVATLLVQSYCEVTELETIKLYTAISVRERNDQNEDTTGDLGCRIMVADSVFKPHSFSFHQLCTQYQQDIREAKAAHRVSTREHAQIASAVSTLSKEEHFQGIGLTNLGVLDISLGTRAGEVLDIQTVVNRVGGNLGLALHLSVMRGRLRFVFTYPRPLMPDQVVTQIAAVLIGKVEAL